MDLSSSPHNMGIKSIATTSNALIPSFDVQTCAAVKTLCMECVWFMVIRWYNWMCVKIHWFFPSPNMMYKIQFYITWPWIMGIWSIYIYNIYIYHIYIWCIYIYIHIPYIYIHTHHIYIPYIYTCDHSISVKCIEMSSKWQVWCQDGIKSFLAQRFMGLLSQGGSHHLRFLAREDQNLIPFNDNDHSCNTFESYACIIHMQIYIYILEKHQQVALGSLRWAFHPHIIDIYDIS